MVLTTTRLVRFQVKDIVGLRLLTCTEDYYKRVKYPFHIIGFDGAGIVEEVGSECVLFQPGEEVFYVANTIRQGTTAEYQLVNEFDEEVEPGQFGEMVVRTADPWIITSGYFHMPDKTAAAWRNGWLRLG